MEREYVGTDLHRRRSVIVRRSEGGETLECARIENHDTGGLARVLSHAGPEPEVIVEATLGWYCLADFLKYAGAKVHLAHPLGNDWGHRRVKNNRRDAEDMADLCRMVRLAEAWVAPPEIRDLRELVRYRIKLRQLRSGLRAQVHAVLAKEGVRVPITDLFGSRQPPARRSAPRGRLRHSARVPARSARGLRPGDGHGQAAVADRLNDHHGYHAILAIPGVGAGLAPNQVRKLQTARSRPSATYERTQPASPHGLAIPLS